MEKQMENQMEKLDIMCVTLVNLNILVRPVDRSIFDRDATLVSDYQVVVGGDGVNQAVTLSRLGNRAGVCGSIGNDHFGRLALLLLRECDINTNAVSINPDAQTAVCLVMVGADGNRNFIVKRGACDCFSLTDIAPSVYSRTKILNIGSLFTFKRLFGHDLAALLQHAQQQHVITTADAMYDSYQIGPKQMQPVFPYLDYFFPSYDEGKYLTGKSDPDQIADQLLALGVKTVVLKLGADGCLLKNASTRLLQPAFSVPAVDTTGAGDNFIAGFLHGILRDWDLKRCLLMASATAAISIGTVGATGAVQSERQVTDWLEKNHIFLY